MQCPSNLFDDLVLQLEYIGQRTVVLISPYVGPGSSLNKLYVNSHSISYLLHAAFQKITYSQYIAHFLKRDRLVFENEGRSSCDHKKRLDTRQSGCNAVYDAIRKIVLLGVVTQVIKCEYCYGWLIGQLKNSIH